MPLKQSNYQFELIKKNLKKAENNPEKRVVFLLKALF